jgi:hypothetical protein
MSTATGMKAAAACRTSVGPHRAAATTKAAMPDLRLELRHLDAVEPDIEADGLELVNVTDQDALLEPDLAGVALDRDGELIGTAPSTTAPFTPLVPSRS